MNHPNPQSDHCPASSVIQDHQARPDTLYVHTFGTLTIQYAGKKIDCANSRSTLIWSILAYLISNPGKPVSTEKLIEHVKGTSGNVNPTNAMRTAIHRARQMLDDLIGTPNNRILISKNGGYMWNPEIPAMVDYREFERLMAEIKEAPTDLEKMLAAFKLYDGKFLSLQSSELWVIPRQVYFHDLYESLLHQMFPLLEKEQKYFDAICVCRKMLLIHPFSEKTYQHLMRFLLMNNEREEVIKVYKKMSKTMLTDLGVLPNQESRALYYQALSVSSSDPLPADDIVQEVSEQYTANGAYTCDYDCFKALYQAHARSIERTMTPSHVVIVTLRPRNSDTTPEDLSQAMEDLETALRQSLRRGDVITRCSASQYMVMLLSADFKNSERVCERFITAFHKAVPQRRYEIQREIRAIRSTPHF